VSVLTRVLSAGQKRKVKKLSGVVDAVNSYEDEYKALSEAELRAKTEEFRARIRDETGGDPAHAALDDLDPILDELLPEAFAVVREASGRTIGQRHFGVQLIGGAVLHQGKISEMKTGEGKTLTATLPVYLNALSGKNVHVVTVNDYLARRDSDWMGQIYRLLGLQVGAIQNQMRPFERRPIYQGEIVYGTNSEFGFDYLRDNMARSPDELVQRGHHFAIVDEVDSILIDEARTPLLISGASEESAKHYYEFATIARKLSKDDHYEVDEAKRTIAVTEDGVHRVEELLGVENLYDQVHTPLVHYLQGAIKAKELYKRDREYVIDQGEIIIVDEFTGRKMPGRRWTDGIHQSVEAKEGVRIREEQQTLATITIQNYFRMYEKLGGMTGTAATEAQEFDHIYKLDVVEVPTNQPMVRDDQEDVIFKTEDAKWRALIEDIKERSTKGQPVLVGTVSIEKNEKLARLLDRQGVPHKVLNARHHEQEAGIIAQAGRPGAVTVATNMAGRGVDIILGGNPEYEAKQEAIAAGLEPDTPETEAFVKDWMERRRADWQQEHAKIVELGGLYVLGTERHESRRIDNQLRGRAGRQGDPGESRFYLSLEDDLMSRFAGDRVASIMDRLKLPEDVPIEAKIVSRSIRRAQGQVEQQNFEARKNVLKYDDVLNTQRKIIYEERDKILAGADIGDHCKEMVEDVVGSIVDTYCPPDEFEEEWDTGGLLVALEEVYPTKLTKEELEGIDHPALQAKIYEELANAYVAKEQELSPDVLRQAERLVLLQIVDAAWMDHLYEMDYLQEGIGLRAMGQRDPLVEYQREGFELFQSLLWRIREDFSKYIFHVHAVNEGPATQQRTARLTYTGPAKTSEAAARQAPPPPQVSAAPQAQGGGDPPMAAEPTYETIRRDADKVGRNDPCPCGSGRKYKKCHGMAAS
jgi:preprotein translocase subunit SecA